MADQGITVFPASTTLSQLFSKDPFKATKDDRKALIAAYRERRKQFNLGQASAGNVNKPLAKATAAVMKEVKTDIDLDL